MFLLINKSKGMTSHDVVDELRRITGVRKIGHAGTLDPNATGLLIVGIGRESTKKLGTIIKDRKTYEAEIYLGEERDTDDVEGVTRKWIPQEVRSSQLTKSQRDDIVGMKSLPTMSNIEKVLKKYVGEQEQMPPQYSAIKKGGKKAYEVARAGGKIKLDTRTVTIYSIELINYKYPLLRITTEVSSGTYIRALARDIGRSLESGAYLKELRRTSIGKYNISDAVSIDQLTPQNWEDFAVQL